MSKEIQNNCAMYFPSIMEQAVEYKEVGQFELVIKLKDGSMWSYYDLNNTMRRLPDDVTSMTEEQCRHEFSLRLRRVMTRKGITQVMLARMIGTDQHSISKYASGKYMPSFYTLDKIARALECSVDDFRCV